MSEWEKIDSNTERMKTWGGWIVLHYDWTNDGGEPVCESMVFIPDINHEWELESSDK